MHTRIRLIIGDARGIIREGLQLLLESEGGIEVVAEAADAVSLVTKTRSFSPDVLVIDERLLAELMAVGIPAPTVVLCNALPRGSDCRLAFVEKDQIFNRLLEVVRQHGSKTALHSAQGQSSRRSRLPTRPPSRGNW